MGFAAGSTGLHVTCDGLFAYQIDRCAPIVLRKEEEPQSDHWHFELELMIQEERICLRLAHRPRILRPVFARGNDIQKYPMLARPGGKLACHRDAIGHRITSDYGLMDCPSVEGRQGPTETLHES